MLVKSPAQPVGRLGWAAQSRKASSFPFRAICGGARHKSDSQWKELKGKVTKVGLLVTGTREREEKK